MEDQIDTNPKNQQDLQKEHYRTIAMEFLQKTEM
jgi:hypothetical protein